MKPAGFDEFARGGRSSGAYAVGCRVGPYEGRLICPEGGPYQSRKCRNDTPLPRLRGNGRRRGASEPATGFYPLPAEERPRVHEKVIAVTRTSGRRASFASGRDARFPVE
jgi:hypothetical protein